uniref:Sof1-like protein domain-containing protein n=1 Tax=Dunaliella tertiolecta TaxID=3047 RepID=A0A7S3QLB8_DUNTE|mmetsp:Transcript_1914/g.4843  ORF Transcript_1914/g.4843 Transcript_1914/m.4843 type:complete len:450 (-) Transcript_1914:555-1904(-)
MRVKAINRNEEEETRERQQDIKKVHRNYDPNLHQFERAHEYTRALNAVKLDRVFAKPFIAAFPHDDGITTLARNPRSLNSIVSGAADGDIRILDIAAKRTLRRLVGHTAAVRGIAFAPDGETAVSCSTDATVKLWKVPFAPLEYGTVQQDAEPVFEFQGKHAFRGIDHHWGRNQFATAGAVVDVWDHTRSEPTHSFAWGSDTVTSARFNPAEADLFATTGSDRSVALFDLRSATPIRKIIMQTRCNALAWNPMEAFNFTVANEDCCLYTYDMRKLTSALCVHKDFVSAVMDVDYSPTGREFVAGSYDRSVRIFPHTGGHSREVYTTKRMQRVFTVRFSGDATYVFSGSDDMNVRVWKSEASEQLGVPLPREKKKHAYNKALINRFQHMPDVKRVTRHRHVPAAIYKTAKVRRTMEESANRKLKNRVAHSAPGSVKIKATRKKKLIAEVE